MEKCSLLYGLWKLNAPTNDIGVGDIRHMILPEYFQPWIEKLSGGWPANAGPLPDEKAVSMALSLGGRPGALYSLAWAMFCRPTGASRGEVLAVCGGPQFNSARDAQRAGRADFMIGPRPDGGSAYYLGPPGSHPGGPDAVPAGRETADDAEQDDSTDADRIRDYVLDRYFIPSRERGQTIVKIPVKEVHDDLSLEQQWANVCQVLEGKKLQALARVAPPTRDGPARSSTTVFSFHLSNANEATASSARQFVLFDSINAAFKPVKNYNRRTGRSAYRVKPVGASNRTEDALEVDTIAEVARAMLQDRLSARLQSTSGGTVNYLSYGQQKLIRYELDPEIAMQIGVPPSGQIDSEMNTDAVKQTELDKDRDQAMTQPTNLILYGPPGTGKTYATAEVAVSLCGEPVPSDRGELMKVYHGLCAAGRIELVTFHQSMSYEDFVEGLRPVQVSDDGAPGFSLKPVHGVFRRIAQRAETSTGPGNIQFDIEGRQVFKMSIGEASNPDDAHLFEEAIDGNYALLGWGDTDWSDDRFANREAILDALKNTATVGNDEINASSGRVQMPYIFRNTVNLGDIIVVSKGNSLFRAIGEVTGDYQFVPRDGGGYAHRRAVRWLWVNRTGLPVSEIYALNFMQKSIYLLNKSDLKLPALERYIVSQQETGLGGAESFVLIVDEINRANISKVFGELITLLEPDKRIGQRNALKVTLPYSQDVFGVPQNLHIIGTMNTADRSIALLDTALRRRFKFRELMPNPDRLHVVEGVNLAALLTSINERIEYLFDREHQIGHAYFLGCETRADVDEVMRYSIIPLLAEYFFEDWSKIALVLGEVYVGEGDGDGKFIDRKKLTPPKGLEEGEDAQTRYRWTVRQNFLYDGYLVE